MIVRVVRKTVSVRSPTATLASTRALLLLLSACSLLRFIFLVLLLCHMVEVEQDVFEEARVQAASVELWQEHTRVYVQGLPRAL